MSPTAPPTAGHSPEIFREIARLDMEERSRQEALLASLQEAVLVFDADGDLVDVNDAAAVLHGFDSREQMVQRYEDASIYKRSTQGGELPASRWPTALARAGRVFKHSECEVWVPETGARFVGSYSGSPVVDENGNVVAAVVTIHDVTLLHERVRLEDALDRIGVIIQSSLELNDIPTQVLSQACSVLQMDASYIALRSDGRWRIAHLTGVAESHLGTGFSDSELPAAVTAEKTRQIVRHSNGGCTGLTDDGSPVPCSEIVAPLFVGELSFGVLAFVHAGSYSPSEVQIEFIKRLSANLSLALNNARIFEAERRVAHTLQEALLQVPERIDGIDFALHYESATDVARVGGDFYDVFCIGETHVCAVVGDVAGKGLEAAVLTSLVKNTIRAYCVTPVNPASVMRRANELLLAHTDYDSFVTVFLGILDLRDGHMTYCNAGHTTGLLVRSAGDAARLEANSPLAGAFDGVQFHSSEVQMGVGETLVLYTDGLTEAGSRDELFGEDRLCALAQDSCAGAPGECVASVMSAVADFAGGTLQDDAAMMALKRLEVVGGGNGCQATLF